MVTGEASHKQCMRNPALSEGTEALVRLTIGCAIRVHRALGVGFWESTHREAMCLELHFSGLEFEREKSIAVTYRGHRVAAQRLDLVVAREVIVEIKAVSALTEIHEAQLIAYLRASKLRVGLLLNFHEVTLSRGLRRIVL